MLRKFSPYALTASFVVLAAFAFGPFPASPASASTFYDCNNPHCYDIGVANNDYAGIYDEFYDRTIQMPSSEVQNGYHMSNEMWLIMSDGQWVEEGLARGCSVAPTTNCSGSGGNDDYMQFWADENSSNGFFFHFIKNLGSSDGVLHQYEIWYSSGGSNTDYSVYLDNNLINVSEDQIYPTGVTLNAGIELFSPGINSGEYTGSNQFDNSIQVYFNSTHAWRYVVLDSATSHDYNSCGGNNNCAMDDCSDFSNGSCLWWSRTDDSDWSDYKPS